MCILACLKCIRRNSQRIGTCILAALQAAVDDVIKLSPEGFSFRVLQVGFQLAGRAGFQPRDFL